MLTIDLVLLIYDILPIQTYYKQWRTSSAVINRGDFILSNYKLYEIGRNLQTSPAILTVSTKGFYVDYYPMIIDKTPENRLKLLIFNFDITPENIQFRNSDGSYSNGDFYIATINYVSKIFYDYRNRNGKWYYYQSSRQLRKKEILIPKYTPACIEAGLGTDFNFQIVITKNQNN